MKTGDMIIIKETPTHYMGYFPIKLGDKLLVEEITHDGYVTTKTYPELYIPIKQVEVVYEGDIRCQVQMPTH